MRKNTEESRKSRPRSLGSERIAFVTVHFKATPCTIHAVARLRRQLVAFEGMSRLVLRLRDDGLRMESNYVDLHNNL